MVIARAMFGMIGAITIGALIGMIHKDSPFKRDKIKNHKGPVIKENCACGQNHSHSYFNNKIVGYIEQIILHTSAELYDIGRFFIMGVFLSTCMQVFIPKTFILSIGGGVLSSIIVMMMLAFVLSVCSETDAFIARSFLGQFTTGSILGFLILGPMIDIKNTIMLCGSFKLNFVVKLIFLIVAICFILAVIANIFPLELLSNTFAL